MKVEKKYAPMSHQKVTGTFLRKHKIVFDMSDAGTGKTLPEILDMWERRSKKHGKCALVLASKSLLESAWADDIQKFCPSLTFSVAWAENRQSAFDADADVYITNHDAAKWLSNQPKKFFEKFDTLIIDESTAYKHHTSQRSKAIGKIAKYFEYRRLMSGTPMTNGVCDIWHQMFILDGGARLGKSFFAFRSAVCTPKQVGPDANMVKWVDKDNAEAIVSALIKDVVVRHIFEDCVDIPPNHRYSINYHLNKRHMERYKELQDESMLMVKDKTVSAINGAVLYAKLLQVASGAVYGDDDDSGEGTYTLLDTGRYELVLDLVEERKQSIVFFYWKHQRDELIKQAEKRGLRYAVFDGSVTRKGEREEITRNFQAGFYDVIFAHPKSAAHGLTWTKGTATIFASATPNLEWYLQGLKRIYRIGQKEKSETIMIIAPGTIEEAVYESLTLKDGKQMTLLEYFKEAA